MSSYSRGAENEDYHLLIDAMGKVLNSALDLNALLNELMQLDRELMQAEACSLMLLDADRRELVFEVAQGDRGDVLRQHRLPVDSGICGWVVTHGQPAIVNNCASDPRFNATVDQKTGFTTRSILAVPLFVGDKVIGVIEVLNKLTGEDFGHDDLQTLAALAAQAATAIESARSYQAVRRERDEMMRTEEGIRRELASELQAGPLQKLAAAEMNVEFAERLLSLSPDRSRSELQKLKAMVRNTTDEVRNILFDLRPLVLDTRGLVAALQSLSRQVAEEGPAPTLNVECYVGRFVRDKERAVFSIVREAMLNAIQHSHASRLDVRLTQENGTLVAVVQDDGVGFDAAGLIAEADRRQAFGIFQSIDRATLLGGSLRIDSTPHQGSTVTLKIPLG